MPDSRRDEGRHEVAARGLTPIAVTHLTVDALGSIDLANLGPVKKLLKRFFSDEAWSSHDDDVLAELVGAGSGWWRHELDDDFRLEFGWRDGAFRLDVAARAAGGEMFAGPVAPEVTPNPRTIRFVTPPIHDGPSRWYASAAEADDARVARVFAEFDDVANVLVGPDFVAVGLHRPDRWEQVLENMLRLVTAEFATTAAEPGSAHLGAAAVEARGDSRRPQATSESDGGRALEQAWKALGALHATEPGDRDRILASVSSTDRAMRQVAARLVADADAGVAENAWGRLLGDPSRSVRRAVVDAMVDAGRPELRALFERALADGDPWTRWKALRGLVDLGVEASRAAVVALADDPDFRVRLEAARALRDPAES
ncbi:MAG: hypothetical protein QOG65_1571 [Actinomycetota bacterium]|jgi:hypothetical protein|nr:hypothetical protein [Actinomycetota bacterium]